ncbi:MAG: hypothetical protein ACE5II_05615 [Anaerolineae bacterium]
MIGSNQMEWAKHPLGGEEAALGPGCCGRAPADLVHGLKNKGSQDLKFF